MEITEIQTSYDAIIGAMAAMGDESIVAQMKNIDVPTTAPLTKGRCFVVPISFHFIIPTNATTSARVMLRNALTAGGFPMNPTLDAILAKPTTEVVFAATINGSGGASSGSIPSTFEYRNSIGVVIPTCHIGNSTTNIFKSGYTFFNQVTCGSSPKDLNIIGQALVYEPNT